MELTLSSPNSYVCFLHEVIDKLMYLDYNDFDIFLQKWCRCGCGYAKIFAFEDGVDVRIDAISRDEARFMYE